MNVEEYATKCRRTDADDQYPAALVRLDDENKLRLLHGVMGVSTEAAELLDAVKKHVFYGRELDLVNVKEELGDLLWYVSLILHCINSSYDEVMELNISKLLVRYRSRFSEGEALNRNLEAERSVLEDK